MSKSPDAFRTIREVADWLGEPTHALRFWEDKFAQVKPVKRAGSRRYYRPSDMALLGGIHTLLRVEGMTIKGVQKVLRDKGTRYVSSLSRPVNDAMPAEYGDTPPEEAPTQSGPSQTDTSADIVPLKAQQDRTITPEPEDGLNSGSKVEPGIEVKATDRPAADQTVETPSEAQPDDSDVKKSGDPSDNHSEGHATNEAATGEGASATIPQEETPEQPDLDLGLPKLPDICDVIEDPADAQPEPRAVAPTPLGVGLPTTDPEPESFATPPALLPLALTLPKVPTDQRASMIATLERLITVAQRLDQSHAK
ncbi:MAG: MerR family transcriptional regulator [Paracoccaceae bacterium]